MRNRGKTGPLKGYQGLTALLVSLSLAACGSTPPKSRATAGADAAATPVRTVTVAQAEPVGIESLELTESAEDRAELRLTADGPLVWTQYRDPADNLIVELPNTVLGAGVTGVAPEAGLVEIVEVEEEANGPRPMTRIVVSTRADAEHSLSVDNGVMNLQFQTVEDSMEVASEVTIEPIDDLSGDEVAMDEPAESGSAGFEVSGELAPIVASTSTARRGTPEDPVLGPPPAGVAASHLALVRVSSEADSTRITLDGDGDFRYSSFWLDDPSRFVVDLEGVIKTATDSLLAVDDGRVARVRMAQFRPYPDPVARVVIDMSSNVEPALRATGDGLVLLFSASAATSFDDAPEPEELTDFGEPGDPTEPLIETASAPTEPLFESVSPADDFEDAPEASEETFEVASAELEPQESVVDETPAEETFEVVDLGVSPAEDEEGDDTLALAEAETFQDPEPVFEPEVVAESETFEPVETLTIATLEDEGEELPPPTTLTLEVPSEAPSEGATSDVSLFEAQEIALALGEEQVENQDQDQDFGVQPLGELAPYVGAPISLTLKDADVTEVLRSIAQFAELNLVIHPGVGGPVTVELTEVPWDQALDQILKINNLGKQTEGNILRIAPIDQLRREAEEEQALKAARELSVPLRTFLKRLSYARAQEVAAILTTGLRSGSGALNSLGLQSGVLSPKGSVSVDQRTNSLIIRELPAYIDTIIQIVESLDIPEKQVMIEARIVETTRNFSRTLGIQWSFDGVASAATGNTTGLQFPNNVSANGGANLLAGGANGFLNIGLGNILDTFELDLTLNAAENDGLVNVVSAPKIATLNNVEASIQTGLQIPIQTVANNTVTVQFVNATLRLLVTPQVTAEGTILMDIDIQKREPQLAFAIVGASNAPIATREARTRVIVRDGGTAVIGGIYVVSNNEGVDKVPGLANVPLLGHLFKNRDRSNQNEELLIFITPRVIQL